MRVDVEPTAPTIPPDVPVSRTRRFIAVLPLSAGLGACEGPQSALVAAGYGAEQVLTLWWWMLGGAVVIWLAVIGIALYATVFRMRPHDPRIGSWLIVAGGAVFPTIVLAVLLFYGLALMPRLRPPAPDDGPVIAVSGEQWWWRVDYVLEDGRTISLANEVRLPVGRQVKFSLTSPDVIHSFWIPSIGGKVDMIPGRVNHLVLEPTQVGVYRGACAEYCGTSHALMNFAAVVMEEAAFEDWLDLQAASARPPQTPVAQHGQDLFLVYGCSACHTIRGTPADGEIGPDLTHVGSRLTLGAGILANEIDDFRKWIAATHDVKPDVNMPAFNMLPESELTALAVYLDGLR